MSDLHEKHRKDDCEWCRGGVPSYRAFGEKANYHARGYGAVGPGVDALNAIPCTALPYPVWAEQTIAELLADRTRLQAAVHEHGVALVDADAKNVELMAGIEDAPHDELCCYPNGPDEFNACNCWKAALIAKYRGTDKPSGDDLTTSVQTPPQWSVKQ